MKRKRNYVILVAVAALVAAFVATVPAAQAGSSSEKVSGSFTDTAIDLNDNGMAANLVSGKAKGGGNPMYEGIWEVDFLPPTGACAPGEVEGAVVGYSIVRRYNNGDLQFSAADPAGAGDLCFDTTNGTAVLTINAIITGGTGNRAGASGSYTATYTVISLLPDFGGGIAHGAFTGTVVST